MVRLVLIFTITTLAYTLLYAAYTAGAKDMAGRVAFTAAVVIGTLLGSTLGQRWFG